MARSSKTLSDRTRLTGERYKTTRSNSDGYKVELPRERYPESTRQREVVEYSTSLPYRERPLPRPLKPTNYGAKWKAGVAIHPATPKRGHTRSQPPLLAHTRAIQIGVPRATRECLKRRIRREVLFSQRSVGSGQRRKHGPYKRKESSNYSC